MIHGLVHNFAQNNENRDFMITENLYLDNLRYFLPLSAII